MAMMASRARKTENCQSVQSFLAAFTEFVESFSSAFMEILVLLTIVNEFPYCNF